MQTEETLQETENAVPAASQEASSSGVASPETVVAKAPQPDEQAASEDAQATGQTADVQPIQSDTPAQPADQAAQPADASEEPFELVPTSEFKQIVETLLFITDRPLKPSRITDVIDGVDARRVREMILEIKDDYIRRNSAVQVVELGGGFQMSTKPEYGRWVRRLYNEKMTAKLSNAALETLAIVAYKQPITRAEMEAIRGVDVAGPLERLLERSLVRVVGKKDTVGRPMVYGTTDEFLRMFGLNKISDLPDLQVFAAKSLREKQEELPFDEPLPPLAEPAIIPVEELEGEERLEAMGSAPDPFFTRNSYNKGDFFGQETQTENAFAQTEQVPAPEASAEAGEPSAEDQKHQPAEVPAQEIADTATEPINAPQTQASADIAATQSEVPQEEK